MTQTASIAPARAKAKIDLVPHEGVPQALDAMSCVAPAEHAFLRAGWFAGSGAETTLVAESGGRPIAAFPTVAAGPPALGARAVAGLYWPFRNMLLAADVEDGEIEQMLRALRSAGTLGPLWRLGPVYADDPTATRLTRLAPAAGWSVLKRPLGRTWTFDVGELRAQRADWPRPSTLKRLGRYERKLRAAGTLEVERIIGDGWTRERLDAFAEVEQASWIAASTDHSGAKFMLPARRTFWERCIADRALAEMLPALLVRLDGRPIAFSFDLEVGGLRYGLAGTYDAEFGNLDVGKFANELNMMWALERGVTRFDWGAGDGGYKREIGFTPGSEIVDLLFVRSPLAAAALRRRWERPREGAPDDSRWLPLTRRERLLVASLATATAVAAMAE